MATSKQSKLKHMIGAPIRVLHKVNNFYMNSLMDCAYRIDYSGPDAGGPVAHVQTLLPKTFYVNSSMNAHDSQSTSLARFVSGTNPRSLVDKPGTQSKIRRVNAMQSNHPMGMRSYSVGVGVMGRIDEDECCSFEAEKGVGLYTKCRSHPSKRKVVYY